MPMKYSPLLSVFLPGTVAAGSGGATLIASDTQKIQFLVTGGGNSFEWLHALPGFFNAA